MIKRRGFRPLAIDALEDRVVLSHATVSHAVTALQTTLPGTLDAQNTAYIRSLYQFVGLTPNVGGVEYHEDRLTSGRISRYQTAQAFLHTPQGANSLTTGLFQLFLGRTPSSSELAFYSRNNRGGSHSLVNEAAQILGSSEYFAASGGTNQGFLTAIYRNLLGRSPGAGDQGFLTALNNGVSRQQVATQILNTPEGAANQVYFAYTRVLRRVPDASSQVYTNYILGGGSLQNVIASLLASQEYYNSTLSSNFFTHEVFNGQISGRVVDDGSTGCPGNAVLQGNVQVIVDHDSTSVFQPGGTVTINITNFTQTPTADMRNSGNIANGICDDYSGNYSGSAHFSSLQGPITLTVSGATNMTVTLQLNGSAPGTGQFSFKASADTASGTLNFA